jgi:hypothetical protein
MAAILNNKFVISTPDNAGNADVSGIVAARRTSGT